MDSALAISTPIMAPVQIIKKQTVVGNTYFKSFFFIIANFKSYNSIIVLSLCAGKAVWLNYRIKLLLPCTRPIYVIHDIMTRHGIFTASKALSPSVHG